MKKEDSKRSPNMKIDKHIRLDRKNSSGLDPNPKKGGHGGWGVEGDRDYYDIVDRNDPNYDSDEDYKEVQILHFNDVYNIDERDSSGVGASRFSTMLT